MATHSDDSAAVQTKGHGCQPAVVITSTVSNIDHTAHRLQRLLSSSYGQERALFAIDYGSRVLHYYCLNSRPSLALLARLRTILQSLQTTSKTAAVPRTLLDNTSGNNTSAPRPRLLALSSLISETRSALRLFGLVGIWTWGSGTLKSPPSDPVLRTVAYTQVLVNVIFQFLDNLAFLTSKGVVSKRFVEKWGGIGKLYMWSCRAWLTHVLLEFVRLARERHLSERSRTAAGKGILNNETPVTQTRAWRKSLVSNLCWAPLCLHWSLENGIGVSSGMTGLVGLSAGAWGLLDAWDATAAAV